MKILAVDIGGSHVKVLCSEHTKPRKAPTGKDFTPTKMVKAVKELAEGWTWDHVSIGYPGLVGASGPLSEPGNLGTGWVGFDFAAAFGCPMKIANDATMQALGSYDGERMFFLGLGTGIGAALIADRTIVPMELGELPWRGRRTSFGDVLSDRGLRAYGKKKWRRAVCTVASRLIKAFLVDYLVIGGGNARYLEELPHGVRLGHNLTAFRGGFRLWGVEDVRVLSTDTPPTDTPAPEPGPELEWRLI